VQVTFGTGRADVFTGQPDGTYTAAPEQFDALAANSDGSYDVTDKDQTVYHFSSGGALQRITDRNGNVTSLGYNGGGQLTTVSAAGGRAFALSYNGDGCIASVTDNSGRGITFGYSPAGDLISVTDPRGHTTGSAYDAVGRTVAVTDALGRAATLGYDAGDDVITRTDALGHSTLTAYDAEGNRLSGASPRGDITAYGYDEDNRLTGVVYADGTGVSYSYDAAGRRAGMTDWRGGVTAYGYDAAGRTSAITYTNGVSAAYSYNAAGQLLGLTYQRGGATLATFAYTYDADGNRLTATDSGGTTTYGYDALDRLTLAQAPGGATAYTYDAAGNRTGVTTPGGTTAYSYNAANELTAAGATTYSYDADGNRLTATTGGATTTYGYDDANYLTSLASGAHGMVYTYNGDHARVGSAVDGVSTGDVLDLAAGLPTVLQQGTSGVTTTYLYGAGLLGQDDGTDLQTLLPDALGSTRLVVGSGGAVVGHASYDAYGAQTVSGAGSVFGFTDQQTDAASGLVFLRARYYDPATGVFLQRDPYPFDPANPVTFNRYSYANGNPVNGIDPSGLSTAGVCGSGAVGFFVGATASVCGVSTTKGAIGFTISGGLGVQSPTGGFSAGSMYDQADKISDLSGFSTCIGGSLVAGGDVCKPSLSGEGKVTGGDVAIDLGTGDAIPEAHGYYNYTLAFEIPNVLSWLAPSALSADQQNGSPNVK